MSELRPTISISSSSALSSLFVFWRVDDDSIQISSFVIEAIGQAPNSDSVAAPVVECQQQWRGEDDSLVRVALEERLHRGIVAVHNDAAYTAELPLATKPIGTTSSC